MFSLVLWQLYLLLVPSDRCQGDKKTGGFPFTGRAALLFSQEGISGRASLFSFLRSEQVPFISKALIFKVAWLKLFARRSSDLPLLLPSQTGLRISHLVGIWDIVSNPR